MNDGVIKFYSRYVDDTLLLIKEEHIDQVVGKFNEFDRNIQFTVDHFENHTPHFLDLEIHNDGLSIFRKETHTAQFTNFDSYTKWNHKIAWIRALVTRAQKICSKSRLANEISKIKTFCAYNNFPKWTVKRLIKNFASSRNNCITTVSNDEHQYSHLYLSLPYLGEESEQIIRKTKSKLYRTFKNPESVKFNVQLRSTKLSCFNSNKEKTPFLSKSHLVYEYKCPGCASTYIGKTETTLFRRTREHAWTQKDSAIYKHLTRCQSYQDIIKMFSLNEHEVDLKEFHMNTVRSNTKILHQCDNWLQLSFLESLSINDHQPKLNDGIKATKEPQLF